jgi:hypothetical protein
MPRFQMSDFNRDNAGAGDKFSQPLDLPGKLTVFLKRGLGQKYYVEPNKLDKPIKKQHKELLQNQFAKATNDYYMRITQIDPDRFRAYEDFAAMEYTPEIASALDIYADESLTKSEEGEILTINCDNARIKKILDNLFYDILDVNHNLWDWTRNMSKYGNHYLLLDVQENRGITGYLPLPVREIRREEAYDGNINSVKFVWETYSLTFDQWQLAHFRIPTDQERLPYGTSMLESARRIWKQLQLAEDAMIVYRITRAPERRIYYIDVGNVKPEDIKQYIENVKNTIKRAPTVTQQTGNQTFRYNPMAVDEDFFIPRRGDKNSEVDTLPGASNLDEIADIEYLQQKMFASLKIPKAYLTFEEDINAKATLAGEDFRFARTINRVQQALLIELNKIAMVHLFTLGFRDRDQLTCFELELTNPSSQAELEKMELLSEKANLFQSLWDETTLSPISLVWGLQNIFNFSDEEIEVILKQQYLEGKMKLEIEEVSGTQPEEGMGLEPAEFGGETEGGPKVDAESGEQLGPKQEDEMDIDTESGLPVEGINAATSVIAKMIEFSKEVRPTPASGKEIRNRLLINNSLVAESSMKMLGNLDEVDLKGLKKISEIEFSKKK